MKGSMQLCFFIEGFLNMFTYMNVEEMNSTKESLLCWLFNVKMN